MKFQIETVFFITFLLTIWDDSWAWNPFEDANRHENINNLEPNLDLSSFLKQLSDFDLTLFETKLENLQSPTWIEDIGKTSKMSTKL